ncbi:MAG: hypothetical protein ACW99U_12755 [Candidatus Thorarchaeota archaeon]|jgi:hypothetical protein
MKRLLLLAIFIVGCGTPKISQEAKDAWNAEPKTKMAYAVLGPEELDREDFSDWIKQYDVLICDEELHPGLLRTDNPNAYYLVYVRSYEMEGKQIDPVWDGAYVDLYSSDSLSVRLQECREETYTGIRILLMSPLRNFTDKSLNGLTFNGIGDETSRTLAFWRLDEQKRIGHKPSINIGWVTSDKSREVTRELARALPYFYLGEFDVSEGEDIR